METACAGCRSPVTCELVRIGRRWAARLRLGPDDAEDLVMGFVLHMLMADLRALDGPVCRLPGRWLAVCARNYALRYRQRQLARWRRERVADPEWVAGCRRELDDAPGADPVAVLLAAELRERVRAALQQLAPRDQQVLRLWYADRLPGVEVARALGARPGTARVRVLRARQRLRALVVERDTCPL